MSSSEKLTATDAKAAKVIWQCRKSSRSFATFAAKYLLMVVANYYLLSELNADCCACLSPCHCWSERTFTSFRCSAAMPSAAAQAAAIVVMVGMRCVIPVVMMAMRMVVLIAQQPRACQVDGKADDGNCNRLVETYGHGIEQPQRRLVCDKQGNHR